MDPASLRILPMLWEISSIENLLLISGSQEAYKRATISAGQPDIMQLKSGLSPSLIAMYSSKSVLYCSNGSLRDNISQKVIAQLYTSHFSSGLFPCRTSGALYLQVPALHDIDWDRSTTVPKSQIFSLSPFSHSSVLSGFISR